MSLSFGTDGVRGVAYEQLSVPFVHALGRAAAATFSTDRWVLGRDTRASGPDLAAAFASGAAAGGATVADLGVAPTPAVAYLAAQESCGGVMISASHNPWVDNGVKLFGEGGLKLSDDQQAAVQRRLDEFLAHPMPIEAVAPTPHPAPHAAYIASVHEALEGRSLEGLSVVLDCANGAASPVARQIFEGAGAEVTLLHHEPDGQNINEGCGSTHPESLQAAVVEEGADLGLAFDGDADRLIAVDDRGGLVDGDRLMALFAVDLRDRDLLAGDTLVVTVMSNLGLRRAMAAAGVQLHETGVGDRHVLEALDRHGFSLGGEQSGHLIFRRLATTGDGIASGLLFADLVSRAPGTSSQLAEDAMVSYPQVLMNVRVAERPLDVDGPLAAAVAEVEERLGDDGRVLIRASGTEPLIRVMVEATTDELAASTAEELVGVVERTFG